MAEGIGGRKVLKEEEEAIKGGKRVKMDCYEDRNLNLRKGKMKMDKGRIKQENGVEGRKINCMDYVKKLIIHKEKTK